MGIFFLDATFKLEVDVELMLTAEPLALFFNGIIEDLLFQFLLGVILVNLVKQI